MSGQMGEHCAAHSFDVTDRSFVWNFVGAIPLLFADGPHQQSGPKTALSLDSHKAPAFELLHNKNVPAALRCAFKGKFSPQHLTVFNTIGREFNN
jgi:hypothetical protein